MVEKSSEKKRTFVDYGWKTNQTANTALGKELGKVINFKEKKFVFTNEDNLREIYIVTNLPDGTITDLTEERFVISQVDGIKNKYLLLFLRIRNALAHGKYRLVLSRNNVKMVIIQDNDKYNVTARILLKLETLLKLIDTIDINKIINKK